MLGAFLPSVPSRARHVDLLIKTEPVGDSETRPRVSAVFTLRELSGAPATHIIYLPRWCHDPPDARVVAYFITLSSWSPPYARPRWCYGISHRKVSSLCLHSAALITAKTTAGATVGMLDVDAILPAMKSRERPCDVHRPDVSSVRRNRYWYSLDR